MPVLRIFFQHSLINEGNFILIELFWQRCLKSIKHSNSTNIHPWDQGQIGIKLRTKHVIYQTLATFL